MAPIDGYNYRIYWAIANLASSIFICLPLTWGLAREQSLKFMAAATGTALAVNAARLINLHDRGAPIRMAWQEAGQMVSAAWIEDISLANLPPSIQRQTTYAGAETENYYLPQLPPPNFQPIAPTPNSQLLTVAENQQTEQPPERGSDRKMPNLSNYPAVLVCGAHGAGKTTFVEGEVQKRLSLGHEVIVLDPHAAYGAWKGCEVVGGGMDYEAIDKKLEWLFQEVKDRYKIIESQPNPSFKTLSTVAEEFTKWSGKCKNSSELFWTANTDIRKIGIKILFSSHIRTLIGLGGAKGAAKLRDDSLLEVELQGEMDEQTGEATPLFQALVKMPGKSLSERYLVPIERNDRQASAPDDRHRAGSLQKLPQPPAENFGSPYGMQAEADSPIVAEILSQPGKFPLFSPALELPHEEKLKIAKIIIAQNLGTEKTILCFWGVTSGGRNHHLYVEARKMLERLMEDLCSN